MNGTVYLVGAGPGDPKLITLRGFELIKIADIVLYDRLVSKEIISMIPRKIKKIYVGRKAGDCDVQNSTNKLMLKYAKTKKNIIRLKGGDPMIFGRGGEEAEYLKEHMIRFEIVPGITSGIGSAIYSGIPLTHRKISSSIAFVTGNENPSKKCKHVKWKKLVNSVDTIVILMGTSKINMICRKLTHYGMNRDTPVAVIQNGTMKNHKTTISTVSSIQKLKWHKKVISPSIIIIGDVVNFTKTLSWRNNIID